MTPNDNVAAIRERLEAITPGEWEAITTPTMPGRVMTDADWEGYGPPVICEDMSHCDAKFVAAAPNDIRTLLSLVDTLQDRLEHVYDMINDHGDRFGQLSTATASLIKAAIRETLDPLTETRIDTESEAHE